MVSMMLQFASYLRYHGIDVSTATLNNAIAALEWVDVLDKRQFYAALESCLVQNEEDRKRFKSTFHSFFSHNSQIALEAEDVAFKMQVKEFIEETRKEGDYIGKILSDYMEGDIVGFMENIGDETTFRPVNVPVASGVGMSKEKVRLKIKAKIKALSDKAVDFAYASLHMHRDKREALSDYLRKLLEQADELL
jgi:uncharacterized protein with von Willebrand factor type A (vWA) domain